MINSKLSIGRQFLNKCIAVDDAVEVLTFLKICILNNNFYSTVKLGKMLKIELLQIRLSEFAASMYINLQVVLTV